MSPPVGSGAVISAWSVQETSIEARTTSHPPAGSISETSQDLGIRKNLIGEIFTHDVYASAMMNNSHSTGGGTGSGNTGWGRKCRSHNRRHHQQHNNTRDVAPPTVLLDDVNDPSYPAHHSHSYPAATSYDMRRDPNQSRSRHGDIDNPQQRGKASNSMHNRGHDDLPRHNGSGRNSYNRLDRDGEGWTVADPYGPPGDW